MWNTTFCDLSNIRICCRFVAVSSYELSAPKLLKILWILTFSIHCENSYTLCIKGKKCSKTLKRSQEYPSDPIFYHLARTKDFFTYSFMGIAVPKSYVHFFIHWFYIQYLYSRCFEVMDYKKLKLGKRMIRVLRIWKQYYWYGPCGHKGIRNQKNPKAWKCSVTLQSKNIMSRTSKSKHQLSGCCVTDMKWERL